jgi:DNA invertase Pin-like site-specific DNA recombinase
LRELEVVVVPSPDRLARNYVHQMVLIEEFEKGGCRVEFVERPMSSEPNDQLLLQIRGAVAEYERTLLSERMRRGTLAKYKAGLLLPWTHVPYGLRVDPDRPRDPAGVSLYPRRRQQWLRRSSRPTSSRERASSASPGTCGRWASRRPGAGRLGVPPPCAEY